MLVVELFDVRVELLPDVHVPRHEVVRVPPHQPDLPVAEGSDRAKRDVLGEGCGAFFLEGGDPGGVDGHGGLFDLV